MKKILLFALLLAAASTLTARAQAWPPLQNHTYTCNYTNPTFGEKNYGTSVFSFVYLNLPGQKSGIEYFDTIHGYRDNRKVTFAKPADLYRPSDSVLWATDWEFTINPSGPQCNARVANGGLTISFTNCSDGSARFCSEPRPPGASG
jgi:hypothetical protein